MNLPYKTLFVASNSVIGFATIHVDNSVVSGPIGSDSIDVEIDNPVTVGWTYTINKSDGSYKWKEPKQ